MVNTKAILAIIFFISTISFTAFSQTKDSIYLDYWPVIGYIFKYQDKYLLPYKARQVMQAKPEAYTEMLKARKNSFGHRLMNIGGILVTTSLVVRYSSKNEVNIYPYLISGAVIGFIGFPFVRAQTTHFKNAVAL